MIAGDHVIQHRKTEALFGFEYPFITFAEIVGQENVIAGTDCGLDGRVHPQIAWAKLRPARRRGDREQEVVELNSKVPGRDERNKSKKV
jgi:hypothetical protein